MVHFAYLGNVISNVTNSTITYLSDTNHNTERRGEFTGGKGDYTPYFTKNIPTPHHKIWKLLQALYALESIWDINSLLSSIRASKIQTAVNPPGEHFRHEVILIPILDGQLITLHETPIIWEWENLKSICVPSETCWDMNWPRLSPPKYMNFICNFVGCSRNWSAKPP